MSKRKINSKLLTYYLNLAELGDKEAEAKAIAIGKKMFSEEEPEVKLVSKIKVIFPTGTVKEYPSAKDVMTKFYMDLGTLRNCIEHGYADAGGRMFEQIESSQKKNNREGAKTTMILFPEIDKKKTKKNVTKLLNTYRSLIRIAGSEHSPKITATYFLEMKNFTIQTVNAMETMQNRKKLAESELLKITAAMNQLDCYDRKLLYDKFMNTTEQTNIAIYMKHHMSESKFYREMDKALIHFAEAYGDGELIIEK